MPAGEDASEETGDDGAGSDVINDAWSPPSIRLSFMSMRRRNIEYTSLGINPYEYNFDNFYGWHEAGPNSPNRIIAL